MICQPPTYQFGAEFYGKLERFVKQFLSSGFTCFKEEFANLDDFIAMANADQSERDDHALRRSPKELYLLEAISYMIYDQLNREAFNRAKDCLVILPDCLSFHNPDCIKTDEPWGDICQRCVPECQACQLSELGERYGARAVFSKRKLSEQIEHYAEKSGGLAVVGVACLMMLANGMRTAAELGVPSRGVLLDFTGCEHWNSQPFASQLHIQRLQAILEEKYGQTDQAADN